MKPDEKAVSAVAFLKAAIAYYHSLGVTVSRVMTDNGSCYKAFDFHNACRALGLKHVRTKPYTPKTNGKAERFIQTACANGPTQGHTPTQIDETSNCQSGSINTTGIDRTAELKP